MTDFLTEHEARNVSTHLMRFQSFSVNETCVSVNKRKTSYSTNSLSPQESLMVSDN